MLLMQQPTLSPADFVIFGALGDLACRKIWPALAARLKDGQLPQNSRLIAVDNKPESELGRISQLADMRGNIIYARAGDWSGLAEILDKDPNPVRVFYMATPPAAFVPLCEAIGEHRLITQQTRVVLEKPIGHDLPSFRAINLAVKKHFSEEQIYRIDHYLGKETVQNLMILRFANELFAQSWSRETIEHVQITVAETIGVEGRASYYDKAGCLRDMVQNHLLQLLCLIAMEPPSRVTPEAVRHEKIKVLQALRPIISDDAEDLVRGQYSGYSEDVGNPASQTETFVALKAHVDNWRWAGVPFYLRTGKKMKRRYSEVVLQFRQVPHPLFPAAEANALIIRIQPEESVKLRMMTKVPGPGGYRLQPVYLNLSLAETFPGQMPDAYERLLMDVVRGNPTLFMHGDEVDAAWGWVDAIHKAWDEDGGSPTPYASGSDGPAASAQLLAKSGHSWHYE